MKFLISPQNLQTLREFRRFVVDKAGRVFQRFPKFIALCFFIFFVVFAQKFFGENSAHANSQNENTINGASIVITEIAAYEPSETEWIEIYNRSDAAVNLSGWKFFEENVNHGLGAFRGSLIVEPAQYAVIANKADLVAQKYPDYAGTLIDSSWGYLKDDGEEIGIKDAFGAFVERFIYPASSSLKSIERIDANNHAADPANWTSGSSSNTIGRPREAANADSPIGTTTSAIVDAGTTTMPNIGTTTPSELAAENSAGTTTASEIAIAGTTPAIGTSSFAGTSSAIGTSSSAGNNAQTIVGTTSQTAVSSTVNLQQNQTGNLNLPPTAVMQIQSGALTAEEETTVNFDGRSSADPNGDALIFLWDMGDGTVSNSANPGPHKFGRPGVYVVTLTVMDSSGAQSIAQQYVHVLNKRPANPAQQARLQLPQPQLPLQSQLQVQSQAQTAQSPQSAAAMPQQPQQQSLPIQLRPRAREQSRQSTDDETDIADAILRLLKSKKIRFEVTGVVMLDENASSAASTAKIKISVAKKSKAKKVEKTSQDDAEEESPQKSAAKSAQESARKSAKISAKKQSKKVAAAATASLARIFRNGDLSDDIRITEIFPYPSQDDADGEWVEIYNGGKSKINLGNWRIADASKKPPYKISGAVSLSPNEYMIFRGSETKIALNNSDDSVTLSDFNGATKAKISFAKAKKGHSYALVRVVGYQGQFASMQNQAPTPQSQWEWISAPTPGQPNPSFEKVKGEVSAVDEDAEDDSKGALEIVTASGQFKIVNFFADVLDPKMAKAAMSNGADIVVQAQKQTDGTYVLRKIEEVKLKFAATASAADGQNLSEQNRNAAVWLWLIFGAATAAVATAILFLARKRLKFYMDRAFR